MITQLATMSRSLTLALLLGALALSTPLCAFADEDNVVVLTEANFDEIIPKSKFALVEFYAPWCGHCKKLDPEYKKAANDLKEYSEENGIVIGKVDATAESSLGDKFGVKGYPTIKWFIDGELASDYQGPRDAAGIAKWIKLKTGPFAVTLDSTEKLAAEEKENDVLFVAYFKELSGGAFDTFKLLATKYEDVAFAMTTDADVAKAAGMKDADSLAVIKNEEQRTVIPMEEKFNAATIKSFVDAEKLPLTIEFNSGNSNKIFKSGIPQQIIFWAKEAEFKSGKAFAALKEVAKEFKGKLVFVTSNSEGSDAEPITKYFGLSGKTGPVVLGFALEKNQKFFFEGEPTVAELSKFAKSLLDGTAEASFKSADIPAEPLDEGVTVVVGKNFNDIVLAKDKDVLLEVYAPWCGHCKSLAPIYVELAKKFAGTSVTIAKMDGTENEHAMVEAKGYPTLLFYPAGENKKPISFSGGDRSLESLVKFIEEKAKLPIAFPDAGESAADDEDGKDEL